MKRLQRVAWILILIVDVGYIAWGAGAAVSPDRLLGPQWHGNSARRVRGVFRRVLVGSLRAAPR